jgi:hypothetical protein
MSRWHASAERYAMLAAVRPVAEHPPSMGCDLSEADDVARASDAVGALAREMQSAQRARGERTLVRTAERIAAREAAAARRNALDWQRIEDLRARQEQRQALALKRRWLVLGRLIDDAMNGDANFRAAVLAVLRTAATRRDDRAVLGLDPE